MFLGINIPGYFFADEELELSNTKIKDNSAVPYRKQIKEENKCIDENESKEYDVITSHDEIENYDNLRLWLEVDGHRYQDSNSSQMLFKIPQLVSYLSQFFSLQSGDIISSGTPPGVGAGQKPEPVYLKAGQTVRLGIEGLGEQIQTCIQA